MNVREGHLVVRERVLFFFMYNYENWLKKIENDTFDICDRLKSIDEGYFVVFNTKRDRYEVHNSFQRETFCFVVPYKQLDSRTVDFCLKTRRQNAMQFFKEIDEHNQALEKLLLDEQEQILTERKERFKKENKL